MTSVLLLSLPASIKGILPQLTEITQCLFHRLSGHSSRDRTSRRIQDLYAVKPPLTETGYKIHPVFHSHSVWSLHFQQTMRDVVTSVYSGTKKNLLFVQHWSIKVLFLIKMF